MRFTDLVPDVAARAVTFLTPEELRALRRVSRCVMSLLPVPPRLVVSLSAVSRQAHLWAAMLEGRGEVHHLAIWGDASDPVSCVRAVLVAVPLARDAVVVFETRSAAAARDVARIGRPRGRGAVPVGIEVRLHTARAARAGIACWAPNVRVVCADVGYIRRDVARLERVLAFTRPLIVRFRVTDPYGDAAAVRALVRYGTAGGSGGRVELRRDISCGLAGAVVATAVLAPNECRGSLGVPVVAVALAWDRVSEAVAWLDALGVAVETVDWGVAEGNFDAPYGVIGLPEATDLATRFPRLRRVRVQAWHIASEIHRFGLTLPSHVDLVLHVARNTLTIVLFASRVVELTGVRPHALAVSAVRTGLLRVAPKLRTIVLSDPTHENADVADAVAAEMRALRPGLCVRYGDHDARCPLHTRTHSESGCWCPW